MNLEDYINKELTKYVNSAEGKTKIDKELKGKGGSGGIASLADIELLRDYIQEEIDNYYSSYTPEVYASTGDLKNALRIEETTDGYSIYFDNEYATKPSLFGGEEGRTDILINDGFRVRSDVWFADIYRFGNYEGFHFIEKALYRFLSQKKNVSVTLSKTYQGNTYEKEIYNSSNYSKLAKYL